MNAKTYQIHPNQTHPNSHSSQARRSPETTEGSDDQKPTAYQSESQWRIADRCNSTQPCTPLKPYPQPPKPPTEIEKVINEKVIKETWVLLGESQKNEYRSDSFSRLAWFLLGLSSFFFLGSLFLLFIRPAVPSPTTPTRPTTPPIVPVTPTPPAPPTPPKPPTPPRGLW